MKRMSGISMLSCAFTSAMLIYTAFLGQNADAKSVEAVQTGAAEAQAWPRFAQADGDVDATAALEALVRQDEERRARAQATGGGTDAANAETGVTGGEKKLSAEVEAGGNAALSALIPAGKVNEETLPKISEAELELYPTAAQCGECHKEIYDEWSSSQHAYSSISPMFHKFEQKFQELTQGTVGTFCVRCHQQVGTQLGENRETPLWARSQISREGVTCITCHRVP